MSPEQTQTCKTNMTAKGPIHLSSNQDLALLQKLPHKSKTTFLKQEI